MRRAEDQFQHFIVDHSTVGVEQSHPPVHVWAINLEVAKDVFWITAIFGGFGQG